MRGTEWVVFALRTLGEAGKATWLTQRVDAVAATGKDFVRVGLMPDIPDQFIIRCFEYSVQRNGQFDDAEAGTEVTASTRDRFDCRLTKFVGKLFKFIVAEVAEIIGRVDAVKQTGIPARMGA